MRGVLVLRTTMGTTLDHQVENGWSTTQGFAEQLCSPLLMSGFAVIHIVQHSQCTSLDCAMYSWLGSPHKVP